MISAPQPKEDYKYIHPTGIIATTYTNATGVLVIDATLDEVVMDIDVTGALAAQLDFVFQIPSDFKSFANQADDIVLQAIQDAQAAGLTITITINFLDDAGTDSDDDTVAATALTAAFAAYDCAIDAGAFAVGDYVIVQVILASGVNLDGCRISVPKVKYIPQ